MKKAVEKVKSIKDEKWKSFADNLYYVQGDFVKKPEESFNNLSTQIRKIQTEKNISDNVLFHLAVSPMFYSKVIQWNWVSQDFQKVKTDGEES